MSWRALGLQNAAADVHIASVDVLDISAAHSGAEQLQAKLSRYKCERGKHMPKMTEDTFTQDILPNLPKHAIFFDKNNKTR